MTQNLGPADVSDGDRRPPPIFAGLRLDDALRAAAQAGKLLVVDATARTCAPCRLMDRTTWRDERVVAWIEQHALAIQVDADEDVPATTRLGLWALPTVVVFDGSTEVQRLRGFRDAPGLLKHLERARQHAAAKRGKAAELD